MSECQLIKRRNASSTTSRNSMRTNVKRCPIPRVLVRPEAYGNHLYSTPALNASHILWGKQMSASADEQGW